MKRACVILSIMSFLCVQAQEQSFFYGFEADETSLMGPDSLKVPVDSVKQLQYYKATDGNSGNGAYTLNDGWVLWDEPVDTALYMINGIAPLTSRGDVVTVVEAGEQHAIDFEAIGGKGGEYYLSYKADTVGSPTSDCQDYEANIFVRGLPIKDNTSYRLSYYVKASAAEGHLQTDVMRGWYNSEKAFSMNGEGGPFIGTKEEFTTDRWERVTMMTYYQNDSVANHYMYKAGYWWTSGWARTFEDGETYNFIVQPDTYFARFSFRGPGVTYYVDDIALTESWIGGAEYYQNIMRVDFGYDTNLAELANAAPQKAIKLPTEYFKISGTDNYTGEYYDEIPVSAAEYHNDGYLYMWIDEEESFDYYEDVKVSFTNPTDEKLQLKYDGDLFPMALDSNWVNAGKIVPDFQNEPAFYNPSVTALSMEQMPPLVQSLEPGTGSFTLDSNTKDIKVTFNKKLYAKLNCSDSEDRGVMAKLTGSGVSEYWIPTAYDEETFTVTFTRQGKYTTPLNGDYTFTVYNMRAVSFGEEGEDYNCIFSFVMNNEPLESIYNAVIAKSDVNVEFSTDELYPWIVEGAKIKNGNCGNRYTSSFITMKYKSEERTEFSFDWVCYNYSNHQPLQLYVDGVLRASTSNSSYTNKRFYLEPGEHVITFRDSIGNSTSTSNDSYIMNVKVREILPLETAVLSKNSQPLTFENDGEWPWTIEDGYIQNSNYGTKYSGSTFSTTFKIDKPSKFSFEQWVNRYDSNTNNASSYHRLKFYINGEHYYSQYYTNGWGKRQVLLEPGEYTIVLSDTIYDTTTAYYSRIRNMELSSNWLEVELASPGTLGVEVLYMVDVLTDVELLKVKGTLNATDWTNIKQMKNLLGLDLSEAKFDAVPGYAFDGLGWLSSVKLPEGMTSIGEYAFRGTQIWKIDIPSTVTSIGQYAFANTCLSEITFPENSVLNTIGYAAFYQCTSLKEFIMPNTVNTLSTSSDYSNYNSTRYYYCRTFYGCSSLNRLHFSDLLSVINYETCYGCTNLTDLKLPATLQSISPRAFYNNSRLPKVAFPEKLTEIGNYAFSGCGNLRKVHFAENLRTIRPYAFEYCGIDSLRLPVKLSSLGEYAFRGCDNMTYIELPSYIGSYNSNFDGCGAIQKIVCQSATPPSISNDPFVNACSKSAITLVVPSFAVVNYKLDTYWYQFGSITEGDDIDYWKITSALSLTNNRRMNGKPDIDLYYGGRFTVGGNAPMETNQLNFFINESNPGRLLNTCENFTADSINTYFDVSANTWYFITPLHDVELIKVTHSANASFVFRYYDAESRASNGTGYSWKNVTDTKLHAGQGYIFQCNAAGTITMPAEAIAHEQVLNTSDVTMTLSVHESTSSANKNWNYIGNPYPTCYDIYYMDFTAPITVWTGSTYKAYSIADDNFVLRPMQSFFVQKPDEVDQIIFHKEGRQLTSSIERASYAPNRVSKNKTERFFFDIQIISEDSLLDETRVVLNEAASVNYELAADASKFMSIHAAVPQIFTLDAEGNGYAINERPAADGTIALAYSTQESAFYTISALHTDGEVWLYDNEANKVVNLTEQDYIFYSENTNGINTSRFTLKLKAEERGGTGIEERYSEANVIVIGHQDCLCITAPEGTKYEIYGIDGRKAGQGKVCGNNTTIILPAGTYIVKVANNVFKTTVF